MRLFYDWVDRNYKCRNLRLVVAYWVSVLGSCGMCLGVHSFWVKLLLCFLWGAAVAWWMPRTLYFITKQRARPLARSTDATALR